jgi:hypothetical protein
VHLLDDFSVSFLKRAGQIDDVKGITEFVFPANNGETSNFNLNEDFRSSVNCLGRCARYLNGKVLASICTSRYLASIKMPAQLKNTVMRDMVKMGSLN